MNLTVETKLTPEEIEIVSKGLFYKGEDDLAKKEAFIDAKVLELLVPYMYALYRTGSGIRPQPPAPVKPPAPQGFGDTLAGWIDRFITKPIKSLSMNCGCDGRRKWLNKHFPYKQK